MSRKKQIGFEQPSLVPLADMLTNTVGIMLFILIFITLGAGGAMIARRLPRERPTKAHACYVLCVEGRVVGFRFAPLLEQFVAPLGRPSGSDLEMWVRAFNARKTETASLVISGEASVDTGPFGLVRPESFEVTLDIQVKPGRGESLDTIGQPASDYRQWLGTLDPKADFVFFMIQPDSLAVFRAARDEAVIRGFDFGWSPQRAREPARFSLTGSGREAGRL